MPQISFLFSGKEALRHNFLAENGSSYLLYPKNMYMLFSKGVHAFPKTFKCLCSRIIRFKKKVCHGFLCGVWDSL